MLSNTENELKKSVAYEKSVCNKKAQSFLDYFCFLGLANSPSVMEVKMAKLLLTDSSVLNLPNF